MVEIIFLYLFVCAIMGHMVGDYILQNNWLALNKSMPGRIGALACTIHVLLYTAAVSLFTGLHSLLFLALVAVPHWVIDRYSLGWTFLKWKNRKSQKPFEGLFKQNWLTSKELEENVWKLSFTAPVYIANDNTFHLICLWILMWFVATGHV
jgi:hypothetical protein